MTVAQLFARIGLKTDENKAKSFNNTMKAVRGTMIGVVFGATTLTAGLLKVTSNALNAAVALKQFNAETGASTDELQKWQSIAVQVNMSAESISSAIKNIVSNQEKIKLGQGSISGYQLLGIDPRQDPFKILEQLRVKTEGLSQGMKKNVLAQLGIGAELIQVLDLTNDEFDRMAANAYILPESAITGMNKAKSALNLAGNAVKYLGGMLAAALSPQIVRVVKKITDWTKANEDGIIKSSTKLLGILESVITALFNAGSMIDTVTRATIGWKVALIALSGVIFLKNAAFWLSPLGLITAGIILLVAVLDDLYRYSKGRASLFGDLMEKYPAFESFVNKLISGFTSLKDLYTAFTTGDDTGMQKILDDWGLFASLVLGVFNLVDKLKNALIYKPDEESVIGDLSTSGLAPGRAGTPSRLGGKPTGISETVPGWKSVSDALLAWKIEVKRVLSEMPIGIPQLIKDPEEWLRTLTEGKTIQDWLVSQPSFRGAGASRSFGDQNNEFNNYVYSNDAEPGAVAESVTDIQQRQINAAFSQLEYSE